MIRSIRFPHHWEEKQTEFKANLDFHFLTLFDNFPRLFFSYFKLNLFWTDLFPDTMMLLFFTIAACGDSKMAHCHDLYDECELNKRLLEILIWKTKDEQPSVHIEAMQSKLMHPTIHSQFKSNKNDAGSCLIVFCFPWHILCFIHLQFFHFK